MFAACLIFAFYAPNQLNQLSIRDIEITRTLEVSEIPGRLEIDLGDLKTSKSYSIKLRLNNRTGFSTSIVGLKGSCGCLKPYISGDAFAKQEAVEATIGLVASREVGDFRQRVTVNFPEGSLFLDLRGRLVGSVDFPTNLDFVDSVAQVVKFPVRPGVDIVRAESLLDIIEVSLVECSGGTATVRIEPKSTVPIAVAKILIECSEGHERRLESYDLHLRFGSIYKLMPATPQFTSKEDYFTTRFFLLCPNEVLRDKLSIEIQFRDGSVIALSSQNCRFEELNRSLFRITARISLAEVDKGVEQLGVSIDGLCVCKVPFQGDLR